jgi:hypothetical protein
LINLDPRQGQEFDAAASSVPKATFDYLASLEWIRANENYCAVGPVKPEDMGIVGLVDLRQWHPRASVSTGCWTSPPIRLINSCTSRIRHTH